jgi:hypothetical protein
MPSLETGRLGLDAGKNASLGLIWFFDNLGIRKSKLP